MAALLVNLGSVASRRNDLKQAAVFYIEGINISRGLNRLGDIGQCLAGMARVIGSQGQPQQAAQLLGTAQLLLDASGQVLEPVDHVEYHHNVAGVRAQLDETTFIAAWEAGRTMTLEQAIAEAIELADVG